MSRRFGPLAVLTMLAAAACLSTQVSAQTTLLANLTHDQESAPNGTAPLLTSTGAPRPLSFGTAVFVLDATQTSMTMNVTVFNIDVNGTQTPDTFDNLVAAHIHVGAPPGSNGPVRWGFFGTPDNDNNPDNLVVTPFATGVGGTFTSVWNQPEGNAGTTLTSNLPGILAGLSYINFHTTQFGGGEIRGQIGAVPEPGTVALFAGLFIPAALLLRRRSA